MIPSLNAQQGDLLIAACAAGDRALVAWRRWSSIADVEALEPGAYSLLPLAYRNLEVHNPPGIVFRKAAAVYRHTWLASEADLRVAASIGAVLKRRRVRFAFAGDIALALVAYPDTGTRPITSIDLLVDRDSHVTALAALSTVSGLARRDPGRRHPVSPAVLTDDHGRLVRLFTELPPAGTERFTRCLLDRAALRPFGGDSSPVIDVVDALLISCRGLHGHDGEAALPVFADLWRHLARVESDGIWPAMITRARDEQLSLTIASALVALQGAGFDSISPSVLKSLKSSPHNWVERWEYRINSRPPSGMPGRGLALDLLRQFREGWTRRTATGVDRVTTVVRVPAITMIHLLDYARDRRRLVLASKPRETVARSPDVSPLSTPDSTATPARPSSGIPAR